MQSFKTPVTEVGSREEGECSSAAATGLSGIVFLLEDDNDRARDLILEAHGRFQVLDIAEFAEEGMAHPRRQTELSDGKVADVKDAPVMAEAIRTILKTEE